MTIVMKACYCGTCDAISHHCGVEFLGELLEDITLKCHRCGSKAVDTLVTCADCGRTLRESKSLYNSEEENYYCADCRTACSVCGEAHEDHRLSVDDEGREWCVYCEMNERIRLSESL